MSETASLLQEIEAFIKKAEMAESTFGGKVANDGKLVARLRGGGSVTLRTAEKIRAFIAASNLQSQSVEAAE